MYESYLWNRRSGPPDPVVRDLENKLACKRYGAATRRRWTRRLVGASVLALDAAAVLFLVLVGVGPADSGGSRIEAPRDLAPAPAVSFDRELEAMPQDSFVVEESDVEPPLVDGPADGPADDAALAQK